MARSDVRTSTLRVERAFRPDPERQIAALLLLLSGGAIRPAVLSDLPSQQVDEPERHGTARS